MQEEGHEVVENPGTDLTTNNIIGTKLNTQSKSNTLGKPNKNLNRRESSASSPQWEDDGESDFDIESLPGSYFCSDSKVIYKMDTGK